MDLYVYENFELQGMITQHDYLKWIRRYNDIGEFEIEMPFSQEMFSLLKINNVLYHRQNNEARFILQKNVTTDSFGNEKLLIIGKCISCILKDRIASYDGSSTVTSLVTQVMNSNFISASNTNRRIPNMVIGSMDLKNNPVISVKYENVDVYTILKENTQQYNIGFTIDYDIPNKRYVFRLYEGKEKAEVKFSKGFNNVIEQEYYIDTKNEKTTCIIADNEGNCTIVNNQLAGLARKEVYTNLNTQSTDTATQQGELYLQQFRKVETMDTVMDTNSIQFEYLKDWNLGDVVTTINKKLDVTIQKNIVEIEEFYDTTGLNLAVTFGDYFFTSPSGGSGGGSSGGGSASGLDGKDGSDGADGISLQYQWNGTQLGIKREDETSYQYTNLKGEKGERGIQGIQGEKGADGYTPIKGIDYFDGKDGTNGKDGADGVNGKDGLTTAVKLGTTQYTHVNGVISLPPYPTTLPANGGNSATVNGHTVNSDVPLNAKFTDTITSINGNTGEITKDDIVALGIPEQDTVYSHPVTHPASMIEEDETHKFVTADEKLLISNGTHSHNNLSLLQTITQSMINGWNNTVSHISDYIKHITSSERSLWNTVGDKVDKITGKGLSTEDFTTNEKNKLSNIENNANNYIHSPTHPATMITGLSTVATSGNYSDLINKPAIPTKTSQLTNDSGYINASSSISGNSATSTKLQTPRKINGVSFDGTRNITISAKPISHTHPKSQISDMPTKLSQFIDDIGASGGEQGALIFDTLAAQQGVKLKEYKVGENYVSEIRLSSNNLLLASKTESRSGTSYITVIKVYADNGTTVKQTITITEKKTSNGYETIVT